MIAGFPCRCPPTPWASGPHANHRCLIGTNRVLVLGYQQDLIAPFIEELGRRLSSHWDRMNGAATQQPEAGGGTEARSACLNPESLASECTG